MEGSEQKAIWYYVGNYGQLGPLTRDQIEELIEDAVIVDDTYVWRPGMADWKPAAETSDLNSRFRSSESAAPPPLPEARAQAPAPSSQRYGANTPAREWQSLSEYGQGSSDRSRVVGGLLNMLPGFGRFYLGYSTHGVLQLLLTFFCIGFGWIWSIVDGLWILSGGVKYDGYGRKLQE